MPSVRASRELRHNRRVGAGEPLDHRMRDGSRPGDQTGHRRGSLVVAETSTIASMLVSASTSPRPLIQSRTALTSSGPGSLSK